MEFQLCQIKLCALDSDEVHSKNIRLIKGKRIVHLKLHKSQKQMYNIRDTARVNVTS